MKVKILKSLAGIFEGKDFKYGKGAIVDIDQKLAKDFIKGKLAVQIKDGNKKNNTRSNRV